MPPVEMPRHEVVEAVVVDARQTIGTVGIGPHPVAEGGLDPCQFFLGCFGRLGIEDPALDAVFDDRVVDLRRRAIERVVQQ